MIESNRHWYAAYLRSRFEKKVYKDLQEKGVESFLPLVEEVHKWSDRMRKVEEPLFRGYVFVRPDTLDRHLILETEGVIRFVGIQGRPSIVRDVEIEWLRRIISRPADLQREHYLDLGERVRVIGGPLTGVEGIVRQLNGQTRVVISLTSIAQSVSVQVEAGLLEPISMGPRSIAL